MKSRASMLAALAAVDLTLGFATQAWMLVHVGAGASTDAYYAGVAPMLVLLAIVQLPLQRAIVAAFTEDRYAQTQRYPALKLYLLVTAAVAVLVALLAAVASGAVDLVYPSLSADAADLAARVMQIQGLAVAITAGNLVLLSLNHVRGRFVQCEGSMAVSSAVAALWVFLTLDRYGVLALASGQLIKAGLSGVCYLFLARRSLGWGTPPWREIWTVVRPLASAGLLSKLAPLVDRSIASGAASGSLTMLVFAQTIFGAAVTVAERAIVAPRLPALKRERAFGEVFGVARRLALAGGGLALLLTAGTLVLLQIDAVVALTSVATLTVLWHMFILLTGFPVGTLGAQWLQATMVLTGQARTSARVMTWCFIAGIPVKLLGFHLGGIHGLAVAMSCYYLASAASLWLLLKRSQRQGRLSAPDVASGL